MKQIMIWLLWIMAGTGLFAGSPKLLVVSDARSVAAGIHILLTHRAELETKWQMAAGADLAAHLLEQGFRQHQDQVDALGCEIQCYDYPFLPFDDYYTAPDHGFIRIRVPNEAVPAALALAAQVLRECADAPDTLLKTAHRSCTMGNRMRTGLRAKADAAWRREVVHAADKGAPMPLYWQGDLPPRDRVKQFLAAYLNPDNLVISVVGDCREVDVRRAVRDAWGLDAAGIPAVEARRVANIAIPDHLQTIQVDSPAPGQVYLLLAIPLPQVTTESAEAAARWLAAHLSDRVSFELRERQGLAYSMGAALETLDGTFWLTVRMVTGPEKMAQAKSGMMDLVHASLAEAITKERLEIVRNALLTRRIMKRLTSINKAFFLGMDVLAGDRPGRADRVDKALSRLTPGDIQQMVNTIPAGRILILVRPDRKEPNPADPSGTGIRRMPASH